MRHKFNKICAGRTGTKPRCARARDTLLITKLERLARSTGAFAQYPRRCSEGCGEFQIAGRSLGRHLHAAWETNVDGPGRVGRVRASPNLLEDARGAGSRKG